MKLFLFQMKMRQKMQMVFEGIWRRLEKENTI